MSSPTPTLPPRPNVENMLANAETRNKFCALFEECLEAISDVFPECENTTYLLTYFKKNVKCTEKQWCEEKNCDKLIRDWHRAIYPHYELADKEDPTLWVQPLPYFGEMSMPEKWIDPGFTEEHKSVLWVYMKGLNKHSRLYNAIPSNMLGQIYDAAQDMLGKFKSGEMKMDLETMNIGDVKNIGEDIMGRLDKNDLEEFVSNLTGLASSMKITGIHDIPRVLGEMGAPGMGGDQSQFTEILNQIFNSNMAQNMAQSMSR